MVEQMMIFGLGFLIAAAFFLMFTPLVHNRAVRLTTRRLREAMPVALSEIGAERDRQRAEFAMAVRRLEVMADELRAKTMTHVAELGKKSKAVDRLREEIAKRDAATSTQVTELGRRSATISQLRADIAQRDAATSLLEARVKSLLGQVRLSERRLVFELLPKSASRHHTPAE